MSKVDDKAQLKQVQQAIDELFSADNEAAERFYEQYIISSKQLSAALANARKKLGLDNLIPRDQGIKAYKKGFHELMNMDERKVIDWTLARLEANSGNPKRNIRELRQRYDQIVDEALKEAGLPDKWRQYMAIFIIKQRPPASISFPPNRYIEADQVHDGSITIKLHKGVRHEEYVKGWAALAPFLGKGRRKIKIPDEQKRMRDLQMYGKRQQGQTVRKLAEEYFTDDIAYTQDATKKALKRQKKLFDKGTDLAK